MIVDKKILKEVKPNEFLRIQSLLRELLFAGETYT